jgi:hypothetical protein
MARVVGAIVLRTEIQVLQHGEAPHARAESGENTAFDQGAFQVEFLEKAKRRDSPMEDVLHTQQFAGGSAGELDSVEA